ncbi:MAG: tetratricopeptide repeat protein [Ignavibacteria bacterium]|nr:tetratricopeptide repeat protein [Ignavibacteria bacterium]
MLSDHYYEQALVAERQGDYSAALGLFRICQDLPELDEGDIWFHFGWCTEQRDGCKSEEAREFYVIAAEKARLPLCRINSYFRAGWIQMHLKETRGAREMYQAAVREGERFDCREEPYVQSMYWLGVVLESDGNYLDAIEQYRSVQSISLGLKPEAMYRELRSLITIGRYHDAFQMCRLFPVKPPSRFPRDRFEELRRLVISEERALAACLDTSWSPVPLEYPDAY